MNPIPKFDCKNCKHDESDICSDCQVTDEGIPTRYEAKDADLDLNWLGTLLALSILPQTEDFKKLFGELKLDDYKEKIKTLEKEIREKQSCAVPKLDGCCTSYYPMNPIPCFRETPTYQEDCYYFSEEQDMSAYIPSCGRILGIEGYEPKNCNKDCPYYISRSKARELIDKYVEEENEK